jgi:prevent-host-death family protein
VFVDEHNPNHKGNVAELAIAKEAADLGLSVLKPLTEHERYDLVLGIAGRLVRVQCKWAKKNGDVVAVSLASSRRGPNGYIRRKYSAAEVDAIGAYCRELDSCFLIPIELVAGHWTVQLRLAPARNGQRAALHFADKYRLGAVAQLAERRRGTAEARGSNPLSSTLESASAVPDGEEVGAHEFRNHFGYYMERAAAGTEILIRRRGKPYARLGPARPTTRLCGSSGGSAQSSQS